MEKLDTIKCPNCNANIWVNKLKYTNNCCDQCGKKVKE